MQHREDHRLRPIREADLPVVLVWRNSDAVRRVMFSDHVISGEEHRRWFERLLAGDDRACLVFEAAGRPVGVVTFSQIDRGHGRCSWGFYLGEAGLPQGTGTILGMQGLDYAFGVLNMRKVCSEVLATNEASLRFHARLGFFSEGRLVRHVLKQGEEVDVVLFGIFREAWMRKRREIEERLSDSGGGDP